MVEYNLGWLKEKGFFKRVIPLEIKGREILVDKKNLLAFVEVFSNEEIEEVKRELLSQKVRYIWFFFPTTGKLKVFRRIGEVKWFYYSARMRSDYLKSRIDKLNKFTPDNMNILFDIRDIVEKFYWQLWEHRILMARSIKELKEDKNKLLAVQHLIDRLIFFYFLAQLKLVKVKNEEREWVLDRKNTRDFFEWICNQLNESDLQKFLNKIFFDVLGQIKESGFVSEEFAIGKERFSIISPCLNGGLFIEEKIEGIPEGKIKISGIKKLILEVLNNYNWIIGEEFPEEEDVIGDLTPEIIGHIYEKFVVSLEQIGIGKIKLKDVQTVREELRYGRKKIGAYYTPEEITNYISMNTIYPCIRDKLKENFGKDGEVLLDNLFKKNNFDKQELGIIKYLYFEILTKIKICDNACGSGSFLIAAGDVLLRLYSRVLKILEDNLSDDKEVKEVLKDIRKSSTRNYYIVRQIIVNNLYGVDIMEGAVEIAKLRFWLWLISQVDPKRVEGKKIETLPNLDFNLMVGNTLIGFIDIEDLEFDFIPVRPKKRWKNLKTKQYLITTWTDKDKVKWLKELAKQKQRFKTLPAHEAIKLKEELNKDIEKARKFLNEKFYSMLKSNGIKISEEEFRDLKPFHWGFEFYEAFNLEKQKEERGFDIIIGNPPHGNLLTPIEKKWMSITHDHSRPNNVAEVFLERSLNQIKLHGRVGYVIPKTIGFYSTWSDIRNFILNQHLLEHLADVGIGFVGVISEQLVPVVKKISKDEIPQIKNHLVSIYVGEPLKIPTYGKQIKFVGVVPQPFMQAHGIFIFRPISETEKEMIETINSKSVRFRQIYEKAFRGLYISDKEKVKLKPGPVLWVDKVPYVSQNGYYITNVKRIGLKKKWIKKANEILKPRLFFKVLRGKRLVCFADIGGKFLTTEKLVNVVLPNNSKYDLRTLMVILNSPVPSFYIQKMIFSETTETSRVMDDVYIGEVPIPTNLPSQRSFITLYNYMLFLNATEEGRTKEKELIEFIDKQMIDPLVYELYFKEKFKQEGIKTNLLELVEPYLKDISNINSDEEKLETIKKVIEKIKNNKKIMGQIEKIKSHPWVRVIEGR
jgi:hypothetical protein